MGKLSSFNQVAHPVHIDLVDLRELMQLSALSVTS